jgi:Uncharacterized protein conserved in bacteria
MHRFVKLFPSLLAAAALLALPAHAQSRSDTISFVVPYAAGGTADTLARHLAEIIRKQSGNVLVIENQGGAGGAIGAAAVANARPDAKTVMLASTSALTIGPNLRKVSYDPLRDFRPVLGAAVGPVAILASRNAPFADFKGMLDYAKAHPQAVRYGTPGMGSVAHLAMEGLQLRAGVSLTHVPYRGESPAIQDALGGVTELLVVNTPTVLQHVQAGSLRALVVLEPKRLPAWPDVPTLAEAGFDGLDYNSDFGVFTPASMPEAAHDEIAALFRNAVATDDFKQLLDKLYLLPGSAQGQQYAAKITDEYKRNAEIIQARNIKAD